MAKVKETIEIRTIVHRVIVCSVCGAESNYKSNAQIEARENRDWFCKKHAPKIGTCPPYDLMIARAFGARILREEQGLNLREIGERFGVSTSRARQLWVRARDMTYQLNFYPKYKDVENKGQVLESWEAAGRDYLAKLK